MEANARLVKADLLASPPPFANDQRLVVQINDSSESVMSNIAEGFGRGTQEEFITFLGYALGSLLETQSHLCAAYDRQYLNKAEFESLYREGNELRQMIIAFIRSMIMPRSGVRNIRRTKSWSEKVSEIYERVTGKPPPEPFRSRSQDGGQTDGDPANDSDSAP